MTPISTRPSIGGDALSGRQRAGTIRHRYWEAVLKDSPVVFWPLNESPGATVVKDWSGHGYNGAVATGPQTLVFGVPGYTSDGATAFQQTSPTDDGPASITNLAVPIGSGAHPFTLEFVLGGWNADDGQQAIALGGAGGGDYWSVIFGSTDVVLLGNAPPFYNWRWALGLDPTASTLHHYAFTSDASLAMSAYADGAALAATTPNKPGPANFSSGGLLIDGDYSTGYEGRLIMADVAVFNYALTPAQIAAHVAAR